jgi:hypothetical protein
MARQVIKALDHTKSVKDRTGSYGPYGRHAENLLPVQPLFKFSYNIEKFAIRSQEVFETSVPKPEDPADFFFVSRTVWEYPVLEFLQKVFDRTLHNFIRFRFCIWRQICHGATQAPIIRKFWDARNPVEQYAITLEEIFTRAPLLKLFRV